MADITIVKNYTTISVDANQNTGIGTTTPLTKLHVGGYGLLPPTIHTETMLLVQHSGIQDGIDDDCHISIIGGATGESELFFGDYNQEGIGRITHNNFDQSLDFQTNNTIKMHISSDGKIGIGTTSPTQLVEIRTSGVADNIFLMKSTAADSYPSLRFSNDVQEWRFYGADGSQSDSFNIYNGTAPNKGTKFLILPNGNIGINSTNPQEKLHIIGNLRVDGSLYSTDWTDVSFGTNWENHGSGFQSVQYKKHGDLVFIRGRATSNANDWSSYPFIFNLPLGLRPSASLTFSQAGDDNSADVSVQVNILSGGEVNWAFGGNGSGWISLDGIVFSVD